MKLHDLFCETGGVGLVKQGVNTTADVRPGEIRRQAAKFGSKTDDDGVPPVARTDGEIGEARSQEIVHKNPSIATLKAIARNNPYGSARFVIYNDGSVVAADSKNFTHQSMAPAMGAWELRGYIQHLDNDDYAYRSMEVYSPAHKDHPMFRTWEKNGIENGNTEQVSEKWTARYKKSINCDNPRGFSQKAHCAGRKKRQAGGKTSSRSVGESRMDELVEHLLDVLGAGGMTEIQALEHINENLDENLRKWFQQKWVRFGPDGKIRGACARGSSKEGKPKCLPQSKAHSLGKKGRATAARRKRREDPNPERKGKAHNVATKESLSCPHCGGEMVEESQIDEKRDACYYKVKSRYKVWPSAYASGALVRCRKKGAKNWGKNRTDELANDPQADIPVS